MNIMEAIQARADGASLDSVLGGLIEDKQVRITLGDIYFQLLEAEDEGGDGGGGKLSGKLRDEIDAVSKAEGPEVAAAVLKIALDKAPDEVQAALTALQGEVGGGAMGDMDFGGAAGGEPESYDEPAAEEEAGDLDFLSDVTSDEGATQAGGDEGEADLTSGDSKTERLVRVLRKRLRNSLILGEAIARRGRRYKVERDHLRDQLGLRESESNLDMRCAEGYCFDVLTNSCVQESRHTTRTVDRILGEMSGDPLDSDNPEEKEVGTEYSGPVSADPGGADPGAASQANTTGKSSAAFTQGGQDPVPGGKAKADMTNNPQPGGHGGGKALGYGEALGIREMTGAAPHTFQSLNSPGEQGFSGSASHYMDPAEQRPLPITSHPDPDDNEAEPHSPEGTGGPPVGSTSGDTRGGDMARTYSGEESVQEALTRHGRHHTQNPLSALFNQEERGPLGQLIESGDHLGERTRTQVANKQQMRDRRFNVGQQKIQARKSMIAERLSQFGVPVPRAQELAEAVGHAMTHGPDHPQVELAKRAIATEVGADYSGQAISDISRIMGGVRG
jgi:hypothetical protein